MRHRYLSFALLLFFTSLSGSRPAMAEQDSTPSKTVPALHETELQCGAGAGEQLLCANVQSGDTPEASSSSSSVAPADSTCTTEYGPCRQYTGCLADGDPYGQVVKEVCCNSSGCWTQSSMIVCGCI